MADASGCVATWDDARQTKMTNGQSGTTERVWIVLLEQACSTSWFRPYSLLAWEASQMVKALHYGDNLEVLRKTIPAETVDLIYSNQGVATKIVQRFRH